MVKEYHVYQCNYDNLRHILSGMGKEDPSLIKNGMAVVVMTYLGRVTLDGVQSGDLIELRSGKKVVVRYVDWDFIYSSEDHLPGLLVQ